LLLHVTRGVSIPGARRADHWQTTWTKIDAGENNSACYVDNGEARRYLANIGFHDEGHGPQKGFTMDYRSTVDELGTLKAQIAALTEREKQLKAALTASGYAALEGNLYRAAITWTERATLDGDAVRALLTEEQVRQCTKVSEVISVRVSARKRAAG
jgi:hypothetical protein